MIVDYKILPINCTPFAVGVEFKFSDGYKIRFVCGLNNSYNSIFKLMIYLYKEINPHKQIQESVPCDNFVILNKKYADPTEYDDEYDYNSDLLNEELNGYTMNYDQSTSTLSVRDEKKISQKISRYTTTIKKIKIKKDYILTLAHKKQIVKILRKINERCDLYNVQIKSLCRELTPYLFHPSRLMRLAEKHNMDLDDFMDYYIESLSL
jgi:hypothetical protein